MEDGHEPKVFGDGPYREPAESCQTLRDSIGEVLEELWVMVYVYDNKVEDWERVSPEFLFSGGVVRCDVAKGDWLQVLETRWKDKMCYLDKYMLEFVLSHGKWWKVDMSTTSPFSRYLGKRLEKVNLIENQYGNMAGAEFWFENEVATFVVGADQTFFFPEKCRDRLTKMKFRVADAL